MKTMSDTKKWMKRGAVIVGVMPLGIILMINFPSMTSEWSLLGPLLLLLGSWGLLGGWVLYKTQSGGANWRWKYPVTRQRWFKENSTTIVWFLHQPLMVITIWGFIGPAIKVLWPLIPIWLTMYNGAGGAIGLLRESASRGKGWLKFISVICLLLSMYWMAVNSVYAVQGKWGVEGPRPNPFEVLGIELPTPAPKPVSGAKVPKGAKPVGSGDQIEVVKSTWSAQAKENKFWVRIAPGDPESVPFFTGPNARIHFEKKWKGCIYVERDGVQYKVDANTPKLLCFYLWDVAKEDIFLRNDGNYVATYLPKGGSLSIRDLLGDINAYPAEGGLYPSFAIWNDHPLLKGGKILGGSISGEFRYMGMSLSDHL